MRAIECTAACNHRRDALFTDGGQHLLLARDLAALIIVPWLADVCLVNDAVCITRVARNGDGRDVNELFNVRMQGGIQDVLRAPDVRLLEFARLAPEAEQSRGMYHILHALHRGEDALALDHIGLDDLDGEVT